MRLASRLFAISAILELMFASGAASAKLSDKTYYDKVYGGWTGKCVGGALGMPIEGWGYRDIQAKHGEITGYLGYFSDDAGMGWSQMLKMVDIATDGEWRHYTATVEVPCVDPNWYAVPIIGMSFEASVKPASYVLKNLRVLYPTPTDSAIWALSDGCHAAPDGQLQFDFTGSRAWARMNSQLGKTLSIESGSQVLLSFDAKWISGDNRVGVAFDYKRKGGRKGFGPDDDTTYEILGLHALETYGPDLSSKHIAKEWLDHLGGGDPSSQLAEHIALGRLSRGILPPESGNHPVGEAIGGQMRAEIWGLVCPGRPDLAAEYARRDGVVAHRDNGVYGEQFVAAMVSAAFYEKDVRKLIDIGLRHIPADCKYADVVREVIGWHQTYPNWRETIREVKAKYPGICDPVYAEAGIVTLALLYGNGDFDKTVLIAAMCGSDTDCNTATVGALMGVMHGEKAISKKWKTPIANRFTCFVSGLEEWKISELAKRICSAGRKVMQRHGDGMKFTEAL